MSPRLAYCHVVASVLASDGRMDDSEREFLESVMDSMSLTEAERELVKNFEGADQAEMVVKSMPLEDRQRLRDDLLGATLADGEISPLEARLVARLTEMLDI